MKTPSNPPLAIALPPASLMRARTIGQIATLIAEYMGGKSEAAVPAPTTSAAPTETAQADAVDLEALSDEEIDRLLEEDAVTENQRAGSARLTTRHVRRQTRAV